ncbi:TPA: hypothetical protein ACN014_004285, partial [Citrobacter freundii]
ELKSLLEQDGELGGFVWAWQDIAGQESVISWITQHSDSDKAFLMLLLSLRSHIISSATGHYLALQVRDIAHLFGGEDMLQERLEHIESEDNFPDQVKDVRAAIALSKSF